MNGSHGFGASSRFIKASIVSMLCTGLVAFWEPVKVFSQISTAVQSPEETIRFRVISNNDYSSFVVNWGPEHRYRLGVLRTFGDYEKVYNAAAFARNKKPYGPAADQFKKEMMVFVSRVIPAVDDVDKELRLEKVVATGTTLDVYFQYRGSAKNSTYQIKATAAAWIPKKDYTRVRFYEGKKLEKELMVSDETAIFPEE